MPAIVFRPAPQIIAGLTLLIVAMLFPGAPVCVGMALVALGAASLAVERYASSPCRTPLLLANLLVYGAIYLLFMGATLDAASRSAGGLSATAQLDLTLSVPLMIWFITTLVSDIRNAMRAEY